VNTLADLNTWSQGVLTFDDLNRDYVVSYTDSTGTVAISKAEQGEIVLNETYDGSFQEIQAIDNTADGVKIQVDLTTFPVNGLVEWGTLPTGVTINETTPNVFEAKNIYTVTDFNTLIAQAKIILVDVETNTTYAIKVLFPTQADPAVEYSDTQTVNLTITSTSDEMTTPATAADYQEDDTNVATTLPTIVDTSPADTVYQFDIAPNNTAVIDDYNYTPPPSGSGTTVSFNSGQRKLTIIGTKTNVQNVIDSITLNPTANSDVSYVFNYDLTNATSGKVTSSSANATVQALVEIDNIGLDRAYTENAVTTNLFSSNPPTISSALSDPSYTVRFDITTFNNTNSDGWLIDNSTNSVPAKFITYTGNQAQVDTWLASNVRYVPPASISTQQQLKVTLTSASQGTDISYFKINGTADATPVAGTGVLTYTSNTTNVSFTDAQKYFLKCDVLVIGAGGVGGTALPTETGVFAACAGGGGGAGALLHGVNVDLLAKAEGNLDFTVGQVGSGTGNSVIEANAVSSIYATCLKGGDGGDGKDDDGDTGGQGGGASGGYDGSSVYPVRGSGTTPTYSITAYTGGSITTQSIDGFDQTNQPAKDPFDGALGAPYNPTDTGNLYETDISGSNQYYCAGGWGGESIPTADWPSRSIPSPGSYVGSGGAGESIERTNTTPSTINKEGRSDGQDGIIILKLYSY
jgi:hypothetical protein